MNRKRSSVRSALLTILLPLLFPAAGAERPPNVVFVLFDDLGYGEPGCYRTGSALRTPHLDSLAREGMRFTDAHSASAVCTPTRYGLLTGRYPWRIGQYGVLTTYSPPIIPPARLTVASLLRQHGYATACIGKWHLGMKWEGRPGTEAAVPVGARLKAGPNAAGFDYFYGYTHARNIGTIIEQDRVVEQVAEAENQPRMAARAVEWIGQRPAGQPFFLYFPMCPPHTPVAPAPAFLDRSGARDEVKNDPRYGDWLYQGDDMLGQVLAALERSGLASNTLVIAASDNGAAGRPYPPWRAAKGSIYEGGHRVPLVARWPGRIAAGSVCDQTVCLNDLLATCAELVGARLPDDAGEDSVSLLPLLRGAAGAPGREATVHQSHAGDLAIRQGAWKLLFLKSGERELYDLASDPGEQRNVAEANGEVVVRLTALFRRYIDEGRSTPGAPQRNEVTPALDGRPAPAGGRGVRKDRPPRSAR